MVNNGLNCNNDKNPVFTSFMLRMYAFMIYAYRSKANPVRTNICLNRCEYMYKII